MAIKITVYVIKANNHCLMYFILSFFICQDSSFTLPPPQFSCSHLLITGIKLSKQYWYWVWQPIKVLPNTQYYPIMENIGQYPIPQCQYRSNPNFCNHYIDDCLMTVCVNASSQIVVDWPIIITTLYRVLPMPCYMAPWLTPLQHTFIPNGVPIPKLALHVIA